MIDLVRAQETLTYLLASTESLKNVTVKSYRRMRLANEIDFRVLITSQRNGRAGAGILVAMPVADAMHTNVSGPVMDWTFPVVFIEEPIVNLDPIAGTLIDAETGAQLLMDALHLFSDEWVGTFYVKGRAMEQEKEYTFPGCLAYRVSLGLSAGKNVQTERVSMLQISVASGLATITSATSDAVIKFTLDETFPASDEGGNPSSFLYTAPITVEAGDVIRAIGYKSGMISSACRRYVVT